MLNDVMCVCDMVRFECCEGVFEDVGVVGDDWEVCVRMCEDG